MIFEIVSHQIGAIFIDADSEEQMRYHFLTHV